MAVPLAAPAQRVDESATRADLALRRDSRLEASDLRVLQALREIDWKLTLGVAETRAENGDRVTSTPFVLRTRFNEGRTAFRLSGSGYSWVRSDDGNASGLNDVNARLTHFLTRSLGVEAGITVPAGGEVGGSSARQRVGALYNHVFGRRWEAQVHGRLTRYDGALGPGEGRVRRQGLVQAAYNLDTPGSSVLAQLVRSYRPGSDGRTSAGLAYEFPLEQRRRPPVVTLGFTRGLTSGAHDNTLEVDFSVRF